MRTILRLFKLNLKLVTISLLCVMLAQAGYGQSRTTTGTDTLKSKIVGPLDFKGTVEELGKTIKGAIVTVYEDADGSGATLTELKKIVTPGNGEFAMKLEINKSYVVRVEKAGYTMKGIDIDTDVRLARPEYTKVPTFEFKVDMVKDLDGLAYKKSVANVFYQIKRNTFDYELDYSKEELEEEEKLLREQEEKRRLAELAAQKKFEMEEAAKLLREMDDASMEEKIKAAITIGNGDKKNTVEILTEIFPVSDTLRAKKADVIYKELQKERLKDAKSAGNINYKSLFAAAEAYEQSVIEEAAKASQKKNEELRSVKLDAERKQEAAMAVQQQALELEMREKIAAANIKETERRRAEEKEKTDKIYFAIFNSNGDKKTAVANIAKSFAKGDPYAEKKAEAIYLEYEKARLTGTTLAKMDYSKLFAAAETAEQQAIKEDIAKADSKERAKTEAYINKENEIKAQEQKVKADAITQGLKTAGQDDASQLSVFVESFDKSDPYRQQKAQAMYEEYVVQKQNLKKTGNANAPMDFGAMFAAADAAEQQAKVAQKEQLVQQKTAEQEKIEKQREEIRQEKLKLGEQAAKDAKQVHMAKMSEAKTQKERDLGKAIEAGAGDRDKTVRAIMGTFAKGTELPEMKAEAMYDAYLEESQRLKSSGKTGSQIDFAVLFKAAEDAELIALQRQFEQQQSVEQEQLKTYEENRLAKSKEVAQVKAVEATKELAVAEKTYEETAKKVEQDRLNRIKEEQEREQAFEKQMAMEQAKREALEQQRQEEVLAKLEADRKARLSAEESEKERLAEAKLADQRKMEAAAKAEADKKLAQAEKERALALAAQQKAEEERKKEEAKRQAAEALAKAEADKARSAAEQKAEAERKKEQERIQAAEALAKAEAERVRIAAEQAAAKVAADQAREQQRLLAEAEKARVAAEQAAAKAAEERSKEEQRLLAEAERAKLVAQEAAAKAEADRIKEEQRVKAEAERVRIANEQAAAKAAAEAKRQQELAAAEEAKRQEEARRQKELADAAEAKRLEEAKRQQELAAAAEAKRLEEAKRQKELADAAEAKRLEEVKRQQELAAAAAEKLRKDEAIARHIATGKQSITKNDPASALNAYNQALALDPLNKEAQLGAKTAQDGLNALAKAEADKKALDDKYRDIITRAERELASGSFVNAKKLFGEAAALNPTDKAAKDGLAEVKRREDELAAAEEEKRQRERRFLLLMQEGAQAMGANNMAVAKQRYAEAAKLKPEDAEPGKKLQQIADAEAQVALAAEEKRKREDEAKRKFAEQQQADAERQKLAEQARKDAMAQADAAKANKQQSDASAELDRAKKFDEIKSNIEKLNMNAEDQRKAFLSELSKLYPLGVTEEKVEGKNYVILRNVINEAGVVTVYEKRTWDWGGVFWFKNGDIAITESLYKLELGKYGK